MKSPKCQVAILTLSFEPDLDHKADVSPCGVQNVDSQYPGCKLYGAETHNRSYTVSSSPLAVFTLQSKGGTDSKFQDVLSLHRITAPVGS